MHTLHWHKSTYSGDSSNCVEIATTPTTIHIRDSKTPIGAHLTVAPSAWAAFLVHAAHAASSGRAHHVDGFQKRKPEPLAQRPTPNAQSGEEDLP
ncbi:DUF397 domain-containing protein [Streptomyces achromogenes]|uniref:DUF397 domain-containing protein n=1 Tax=Streptomyces achromogenes TaxID=67255 RepID=UPI0033F4CB48